MFLVLLPLKLRFWYLLGRGVFSRGGVWYEDHGIKNLKEKQKFKTREVDED